jgi:DNA-directed RNA polymerase
MLRKKGSHDYRGRMYPDSDALNAVSEGDLARGLLQFARAEPLGARGRFWLAVHIANCYGRGDECGKLASLNQRAAWTERNGARLLSFMESILDALPRANSVPESGMRGQQTAKKPYREPA